MREKDRNGFAKKKSLNLGANASMNFDQYFGTGLLESTLCRRRRSLRSRRLKGKGKGNRRARGGGKETPPCFPLACGLALKFPSPSFSNACHNSVIYTQGSRKFCISDKCKVKFIPSYSCILSYLI